MVTDLDLFHLKSLLRPLTPLIQVGSSGLKPAQPLGSPVSSQSETGPAPDVTVFQSKTRTAYDVTVFQSEAKTSPDVIVSGQVGFWGESETNATHDDVTVQFWSESGTASDVSFRPGQVYIYYEASTALTLPFQMGSGLWNQHSP